MKNLRIAVLGFGSPPGPSCSASWKIICRLAHEVGEELAKKRATVVCGGTTGIFKEAFLGAHTHDGKTIAILERNSMLDPRALDEVLKTHECVELEPTNLLKHARIIETCHGAIVVGGWTSTMALVTGFKAEKKEVACIEHSGGVAEAIAWRGLFKNSGINFIRDRDPERCVRKLINTIEESQKLKEKVA